MCMSEVNQKERLIYFERRLAEAKGKALAKERFFPAFSAGFTTEKCKSWPEIIKIIQDRIARIRENLPGE